MKKVEIRLTGVGGQGVVLSSVILGRAASVYDKINAVQTQTYGSDMRGGDVCTEVIISEEKIIYPIINNPDILIALAQRAYDNHIKDLKPNGILITDSNLVKIDTSFKENIYYYDMFNKIAIDQFKKKITANMIMMGFIYKKTGVVSYHSLKKAIIDLLPSKTYKLNKKALDLGIELAE